MFESSPSPGTDASPDSPWNDGTNTNRKFTYPSQQNQTCENGTTLQNGHLSAEEDTDALNRSFNDSFESTENDQNLRVKRSTKSQQRLKRQQTKRDKMEELKNMYKHFEEQRGSNDLYQTMLNAYEDFLENTDYCELDLNNNVENNVEPGSEHYHRHRQTSVADCRPAREALMKRDLVLTELADTEKDYVEALDFMVNVSRKTFSFGEGVFSLN